MEIAEMKYFIKSFVFVTGFWVFFLWIYLYREALVPGDELKAVVERSSFKSYSSWFLYREDDEKYCLKLSRPIVPERFCVPKSDVEIRNAGDGGSEIGVIYKGEWILKKNRYPGAKEESF
jgi:hypothetical protein